MVYLNIIVANSAIWQNEQSHREVGTILNNLPHYTYGNDRNLIKAFFCENIRQMFNGNIILFKINCHKATLILHRDLNKYVNTKHDTISTHAWFSNAFFFFFLMLTFEQNSLKLLADKNLPLLCLLLWAEGKVEEVSCPSAWVLVAYCIGQKSANYDRSTAAACNNSESSWGDCA